LTDHSNLAIHHLLLKKSFYHELLSIGILDLVLLIEACPQLLVGLEALHSSFDDD